MKSQHRRPLRSTAAALAGALLFFSGTALAQDYDALIQQALQQRNAGDMEAAERTLRQAWDLPADRSEVAYLLGMVLAFQERYAAAMEVLDGATAAYPGDNNLQLARARVLSYQGVYQEARLGVDAVLAQEPDNTDALNLAGRIDLYQQRPSLASEQFLRVLQLDPDNLDALLGLHDSHRALGETADAQARLAQAAALAPTHIDVLSRQDPTTFGSQPRYQLSTGFSRSTIDLDGFADWNDRFLEYRHLEANGNQQYLRLEHNHRFGAHDTLVELGIALGQDGALPVELSFGFTPDSDFMPSGLARIQGRKVLLEGDAGFGTIVATGLYQYSDFNNGNTDRLMAGLEYYLPGIDVWLTPAIGAVRDQDGVDTFAWGLGAHWQVGVATRIGASYTDAPETENLITTDSRNRYLYLQRNLGDQLRLLLGYSRFERKDSYTREQIDAVLQSRF